VSDICDAIANIYEENKSAQDFNVSSIADFDAVKSKICFKLVNAVLLTETPHRLF